VVVTDIIMPDMEGLEMIKELRRLAPKAKIIAMSGGGRFSPDNYLEFARRIGAVAALAKPFSTEELLKILDRLLLPPTETPPAP